VAEALIRSTGDPVQADIGRHRIAHDLVLPTLLFAALGGMTWAVRGCSGFGAVAGCVFAGVTWGAAWWFITQSPDGERRRRYDSGWIVLALTVGVGLSGERGWMQWPHFFDGKLMTDAGKGAFVPIPRAYGFLWMFLAGVPWAGLGACLLAWCGSLRPTRPWHWALRVACGLGGALLARHLLSTYPQAFLPLYDSLEARYHDLGANPSLRRLINDCGAALTHLGAYLGLLLYEILRREGKNVVLILTVGLVNGAGWALCQNWAWAKRVWPGSHFNFWRCWESSGGLSIGIAYGIAYALVNREMPEGERSALASRRAVAGPNFEWLLVFLGLTWGLGLLFRRHLGGWGNLDLAVILLFGAAYYLRNRRFVRPAEGAGIGWVAAVLAAALTAGLFVSGRVTWWSEVLGSVTVLLLGWVCYFANRPAFDEEARVTTPAGGDPALERFGLSLGLLTGLGLSVRNGLKGWCNIYLGHEDYWSRRLWDVLGPLFLAGLVAIAVGFLVRPSPREPSARRFPHAYGLMWLVLVVQNVIALLVTGPLTDWNEMAFSIYYLLLFLISATVVFHYQTLRESARRDAGGPASDGPSQLLPRPYVS
jgi:hypothetical protein